jgi:hypothetical protein
MAWSRCPLYPNLKKRFLLGCAKSFIRRFGTPKKTRFFAVCVPLPSRLNSRLKVLSINYFWPIEYVPNGVGYAKNKPQYFLQY